MAEIRVARAGGGDDGYTLEVTVIERGSSTTHLVTLASRDHRRLAGEEAPEDFVSRCFAYLLEREPKESILSRFDVTDIGRYFPDFEERIRAT